MRELLTERKAMGCSSCYRLQPVWPVLLVDAGLALCVAAAGAWLRPLALWPAVTAPAAASVLVAGLALLAAGLCWPARPIRLPGPSMLLDQVVPDFAFGESHARLVRAPAERVDEAIRRVSAGEITFFRAFTWLRAPRLTGRGQPGILNPGKSRPILEVALADRFVVLRDEPGRELVLGRIVCCAPLPQPRNAVEFEALDRAGLARQ